MPGPPRRLPLARAVDDYLRGPGRGDERSPGGRPYLRLHVPGHQGGSGAPPWLVRRWGLPLWLDDLTEVPGLDDLAAPTGAIALSQSRTAEAFGAAHAYYLVGGTTGGLVATILAVARTSPDRTAVILPRHSHRAMVGAMVLSGLEPVFCRPASVHAGLACGLELTHLASLLREHGHRAAAVMDVYPTAHGRAGDLGAVAALARAAGLPLLVDGAHAGLCGLDPRLPPAPLTQGADAVVVSAHKTLGSLGQSSLLLLGGGPRAPDPAAVASALRLVQTTSPSYPMLLSLEAAVHHCLESAGGRRLLRRALDAAVRTAQEAGAAGCPVLGAPGTGLTQDPMRVVLDAWSLGASGYELAGWLRRDGPVQVEASDWRTVLLAMGPGQSRSAMRRVPVCIRRFPRRDPGGPDGSRQAERLAQAALLGWPRRVEAVRTAWLTKPAPVPLAQAAGRVAAEAVSLYPPGIPVVWPGEEISGDAVRLVQLFLSLGGAAHGLTGPAPGAGAGAGAGGGRTAGGPGPGEAQVLQVLVMAEEA